MTFCDWQATALVDQPPHRLSGGTRQPEKEMVFLEGVPYQVTIMFTPSTPFSNLNVPFMGIAWGFGGLGNVGGGLVGVW